VDFADTRRDVHVNRTIIITVFLFTIDIRWVSQNNKILLRCKESKDRQHVSALFYKAIIRSDMVVFILFHKLTGYWNYIRYVYIGSTLSRHGYN